MLDDLALQQLEERVRLAEYIASNADSSITDLFHKKLRNSQKETNDYVTELDRSIESLALKCVLESFPQDGFAGEENPGKQTESKFEWVVDPIDGTNNYVRGLPLCGFQLAIIYQGETVFALISRPLTQERYTAMPGKGAFYQNTLTGEKTRIQVSSRRLPDSMGILDARVGKSDQASTKILLAVADKVGSLRIFGTAVFDLPAVASGAVEFLVTGISKKYDIAAGMLLIREAGGMAYKPSGAPATIDDEVVIFSNVAVASDVMAITKAVGL